MFSICSAAYAAFTHAGLITRYTERSTWCCQGHAIYEEDRKPAENFRMKF